jgi:hypothetical protein
MEALEEIAEVGIEPVRSDVVFSEEGVVKVREGGGGLEELPDAGRDPIDAIVDAGVDLEDDGFTGQVARDLRGGRAQGAGGGEFQGFGHVGSLRDKWANGGSM